MLNRDSEPFPQIPVERSRSVLTTVAGYWLSTCTVYVENHLLQKPDLTGRNSVNMSGCAQRIMDDIIDLELEKVDAILEKIYSDPEDEEIKRVEIKLWENIKTKSPGRQKNRCGYYSRRRYAGCTGIALWKRECHRFFG